MKPKILVVDDEWSMRELLKNSLLLSGFDVLLASNDQEFREQIFKGRPDAVILDIMLGDKDGTQVYQKLLAEGLDKTLPIIFLSALAGDRPPTPPRANRRYALIGKPFDCDELVRELHEVIDARHKAA